MSSQSNFDMFNSPGFDGGMQQPVMGGMAAAAPKHHTPWALLLSLILVVLIGLCITGLVMGWISLGKPQKCPEPNTCPLPEPCPEPEPQVCPEQAECPACDECPTEERECPVCPTTECPACPQVPVQPQLEQKGPEVSPGAKPVVVKDCQTSPGCPECMVWDGKRCRYPRGLTKRNKKESFMLL